MEPYREITFDKEGDGPAGQSAALAALARQGVTDLVVFAHGWNNSPSGATRLCSDFFEPFPGLLAPGVEAGYAGVIWPSMMFTGEPVSDYRALVTVLPEKEPVIDRLTELLATAPPDEAAFAEFGALLRDLTDVPSGGGPEGFSEAAEPVPEFLVADPVDVCAVFTEALEPAGPGPGVAAPGAVGPDDVGLGVVGPDGVGPGVVGPDGVGPGVVGPGGYGEEGFGEGLKRYWKGAREVLRQATYYVMKKRSGQVGEFGLGPLLGEVARAAPRLRVHLVGHSMGARLVACALKGLPPGARPVASVTLLQGAFSHYAFAAQLPHDTRRSGALRDMQQRVRGPVVACYSRHDTALGVMYPLASRLANDDAEAVPGARLLGLDDPRWGAIGHDGVQAVPGTVVRPLAALLREGVPASGFVSVDASDVVSGHSDIRRPELARVVVSAARAGR
ncbi:alpha/beta fold hydrolase [Streptomyces venezuelae]|uniref:alpha/beta fold hydrolase n=1 Tax=Streptomyces venezuelae TaxID=54571 RepID=UPI0002F707AB